jgi:hypothetical protein
MPNRLVYLALCAGLFASSSHAADPAQAERAFTQLQKLAGSWQLISHEGAAKSAFRISYRIISRGTALVETFGNPATGMTETLYHRAGPNLMATHYCAQGNQPRLLLAPDSTVSLLHFRFLDVTNLAHSEDSHLVDLKFTIEADGRLRRVETYRANGADETSTLLLEREPAAR